MSTPILCVGPSNSQTIQSCLWYWVVAAAIAAVVTAVLYTLILVPFCYICRSTAKEGKHMELSSVNPVSKRGYIN